MFDDTNTSFANMIGFMLYAIFNFFKNMLEGYTALLIVFSVGMIIILIGYYIRKEMRPI